MNKNILTLLLIPLISFSNTTNLTDNYFQEIAFEELPQEIQGNWFNSNENYQWVLGIYTNSIIYKNEIWNLDKITATKNTYQFKISKNKKIKSLYLNHNEQNIYVFGEDPNNLKISIVKKVDYSKKAKIKLQSHFNVFDNGKVNYKGFIKGFEPQMNREIKIHIPNVITGSVEEFEFYIEQDGTFDISFPVRYSSIAYVRNENFEEKVFFQANSSFVHFIDLSEHQKKYESILIKNQRKREAIFMGDNAITNNELKLVEDISVYDGVIISDVIIEMDNFEYRDYCLNLSSQKLNELKKRVNEYSISRNTELLKEMSIKYSYASRILDFDWQYKRAYRKKKKQNNKKTEFSYPYDFYDFLAPSLYNNKESMATGFPYYNLIQRLNNGGPIFPTGYINYFVLLSKKINENSIHLSKEENLMMSELQTTKTKSNFDSIVEKFKSTWEPFEKKNNKLIEDCKDECFYDKMSSNRLKYFQLSSFVNDLIYCQTKAILTRNKLKYFTKKQIEDIHKSVLNNNVKHILLEYDKSEKEKHLAAEKGLKPLVTFDLSKTDKKDVIKQIINNHKGKIIIFDFWATWCGPCLKAINDSRPFKTKVAYKDIEFVYISGHTSPNSRWETVIQSIGGNQYKLNEEQWNYISEKYNITNIPRYFFIDKKGVIIHDDIGHPFFSDTSKILIEKHIN